jgi:LPS sulfotransferase NodH
LSEALIDTGVAGFPEEFLRPDWYARFKANKILQYQHRLHRDDAWPDGTRNSTLEDVEGSSSADFEDFLQAVLPLGATPNGVFGLKVHWQQFDTAMTRLRARPGSDSKSDAELLDEWLPGIKLVYLRRQDEIRRAISHYRAIVSDEWWRKAETSIGGIDLGAPTLADISEVDRLRRKAALHNREWRDFFARSHANVCEITYEELVVDPTRAVTKVLAHIGVDQPVAAIQPRLQRQADGWTDAVVHAYVTWRRGNEAMPERKNRLARLT